MSQETKLFSIEDNGTRIQEIAFADQVSFSFPFELFEQGDLDVFLTPAGQEPNPTADLLVLNVNYTITPTLFPIPSGNVNLIIPANLDDVITMNRAVPNERNTQYEVAGPITGKQLDTDFDRIIAMIQQLENLILNQALTYEVTDLLIDRTKNNILPKLPAKAAGKFPVWTKNSDDVLIAVEFEEDADASTLRSELASQNVLSPGTGLIGYFDGLNSIGRTLTQQLDFIMEGLPSTGDMKDGFKLVADTGWIIMDDGDIGNAASGASTRANADTEDLFTLLWNNTIQANVVVSGGPRGLSAIEDFNANKKIDLPKTKGRSLMNATSFIDTLNASVEGTSTASLSVNNLAPHSHSVTDPGHTHTVNVASQLVASFNASLNGVTTNGSNRTALLNTTGISIASTGLGESFSIQSPVTLCTRQIKL